MVNFRTLLAIGDMRTTGEADYIAHFVLKYPKRFSEVFNLMADREAGVRMRAADATEKVCRQRPQLIKPYIGKLIAKIAPIAQQEVQWHVAQLFGHATLTKAQTKKAVDILFTYIKETESNIVKVFSIQALADIAERDSQYKKAVLALIAKEMKSGHKSIVSRGRKLLRQLSESNES